MEDNLDGSEVLEFFIAITNMPSLDILIQLTGCPWIKTGTNQSDKLEQISGYFAAINVSSEKRRAFSWNSSNYTIAINKIH